MKRIIRIAPFIIIVVALITISASSGIADESEGVLISYYYRKKEYDYSYKNAVSYHYFTDEDYQNAIQEKKDENAIVDNDL